MKNYIKLNQSARRSPFSGNNIKFLIHFGLARERDFEVENDVLSISSALLSAPTNYLINSFLMKCDRPQALQTHNKIQKRRVKCLERKYERDNRVNSKHVRRSEPLQVVKKHLIYYTHSTKKDDLPPRSLDSAFGISIVNVFLNAICSTFFLLLRVLKRAWEQRGRKSKMKTKKLIPKILQDETKDSKQEFFLSLSRL